MTNKPSIESVIGYIPTEYYAVELPKLTISEAVAKTKRKKKRSLEEIGIKKEQFSAITSGDNYTLDTLLTLLHEMNLKIRIKANNCYVSDVYVQKIIEPMRHESIDKFLMKIYQLNQDLQIKEIN